MILLALGGQPAAAEPKVQFFRAQAGRSTITSGQSVTLEWSVTGAREVHIEPGIGKVAAKAQQTVAPLDGLTTFTLIAIDKKGRKEQAITTITVEPSATGGENHLGLGRLTGRIFLLPKEREPAGLGLYSYLLLGQKPDAHTRPLYLAVVTALARRVPALDKLTDIPLQRVNGLFVPVTATVAEPAVGEEAKFAARVLELYDYARAQKILAALDRKQQLGPYFVSWHRSVDIGQEVTKPYLFQDLTAVPPSVAGGCVDYFLSQAIQEKPWERSLLQGFAQKLRVELERISTISMQTAVIFVP